MMRVSARRRRGRARRRRVRARRRRVRARRRRVGARRRRVRPRRRRDVACRHLRAKENVPDIVCCRLLEKKKELRTDLHYVKDAAFHLS